MSSQAMDYGTRNYLQGSALPFQDYYSPLQLSHSTRANPRGYSMGGPVGGIHGRLDVGRDEHRPEFGSARRRIAVACARCRKRKIRCSGDPGNGAGCSSCLMANLQPHQCQFHRVGSDSVQKVYEARTTANNLTNMASANGMVSIYSNSGGAPFPRSMAPHQYPQVDTKPYPSSWTVPYQEDTSPIDHYQLDPPPIYLRDPTPMGHPNMYGSSYKWNHPIHKQLHGSSNYMDPDSTYSSHGLPYLQPSYRSTDPLSPSPNVNSMQTILPERPLVHQFHGSGTVATQRLLPIPQPSPAQTSRVSFDLEHDQRLRCGQGIGSSTLDEKPSYAKPLLPWGHEGDVPNNVSETATAEASQTVTSSNAPAATEAEIGFLAATTSISNEDLAASLAPQMQLNFSTSGLLDPMSVTSSANTYSNFRESHASNVSSTQMPRESPQNNYYSFDSDNSLKRKSVGGGSLNNGTLASGFCYQPLPHSPSYSSSSEKKSRRDALSNRHSPAHRGSMNNLNSTFRV